MPNWCFNCLTVSKHNESGLKLIQAFKPDHAQGEVDASPFMALMPTPDELMATQASFGSNDPELIAKNEANIKKFGHANWYDWRLANWGTKWDASEVCFTEEDDTCATIRFDTAWSPPTELLQWYAEQNPDVIFVNTYDEEGMGFEGFECNGPESGFEQQCWETYEAPRFEDLLDQIPEGQAHSEK